MFLRRNPSPHFAFADAGAFVRLPFPGHFERAAGCDFKTPGILAGKRARDGAEARKVDDLSTAKGSAAGV